MFELLLTILFGYLLIKALALALRIAWSIAKVIAVIFTILALPTLIVGLVFAGGTFLLIPLGMVALAVGLLKNCA